MYKAMAGTLSPNKLYTTFYNNLFVLKTTVKTNGQQVEIDFSNDELTLRCRSPELSICFREVSAQLSALLRNYGVCQVNSVWCGAEPFLHVAFSSEDGLETFLNTKHRVEIDLASLFSQQLTTRPDCDVETALFLVSPNADQKNATIYDVTESNCSECLSMLKKSDVFEFGPLFQHYLSSHPNRANDKPDLRELTLQLEEVTDWLHLGICLEVPFQELLDIEEFRRGKRKQCKTDMLMSWLQYGTQLTWASMVRALQWIKMEPLAKTIATKYGVYMKEQPIPPDIAKHLVKVPVSWEDLKKGAQELSVTREAIKEKTKMKVAIEVKCGETKRQLKESSQKLEELKKENEDAKRELEEKEEELGFLRKQEQQQSVNEFLRSVITNKEAEISHLDQEATRVEQELSRARDDHLSMAAKHVKELCEERDRIKKDLDKKENEYHFLCLHKQSENNNTKLRAAIERKETEINRLCYHMTANENDLSVAQEEHKELHQHFRQTTAELVEKYEQVRELERTRADLERERNRVDTKLMRVIAKSEGVELPKVDTSHEVEKNVRKREEEVRQLSGLLLSREAEEEDEEDLEKSYLRVKLEEAEDRRMWAEEEAEYRRMREEEEAEYRRMREEEEAEDKMREEEKVAEDRRMREEEEAAEDRRMRVEEEAAENRRMREEEEAEDRRMRAGEELKIMHSRLTDMANEKPSVNKQPHGHSHELAIAPSYQSAIALTPYGHNPALMLGHGSMVQISDQPWYGVLQWIGKLPDVNEAIAGIELEEPMKGCSDGSWKGTQYFQCQPGRGFFCPLSAIHLDGRFTPLGEIPRGAALPNQHSHASSSCSILATATNQHGHDITLMSLLAKFSKVPQERMREMKELVKRKELEKLIICHVLMVEYKLENTQQAEMVMVLMEEMEEEGQDYPLSYYINAAKDYKTFGEAKEKFIKPCPICGSGYPIHEMVMMPGCMHSTCKDCFKGHFTVVIKDQGVKHFNCMECSEPDLSNLDGISEHYLEIFTHLIKLHVDVEMYHLYQKKLMEFNLSNGKEPGFCWCTNTNCRSGFINDYRQDVKCVMCPNCWEKMCYQCKQPWEEQHHGISCEEFAQWKADNNPEAQELDLAIHLKSNGIECPNCHMHYDLARGSCIHFRCTQCPNEFCSGCGQSFKDRDCGKFESCATKGLHAHHPRDCLYHLRDFSVEELQMFLKANNIAFDTDPTPEQLEVAREKACVEMWEEREALEGVEEEEIHLELKCIVMLQKEIPDGFMDEECGRDVVEGHAGICDLHYKEYLVRKINQRGLDPISMYETNVVKVVLMREELEVPEREEEEEEEEDYRERLIKHVQEQLPLQRINMECTVLQVSVRESGDKEKWKKSDVRAKLQLEEAVDRRMRSEEELMLGISSLVQISDPLRYGVLRWIGELPDVKGTIAGVEMEEPMNGCSDGSWKGTQYFQCQLGRGFFCPLSAVHPDVRFTPLGVIPRGAAALPNQHFRASSSCSVPAITPNPWGHDLTLMSLLAKLSKEPQERMREIKELVKREELEKLIYCQVLMAEYKLENTERAEMVMALMEEMEEEGQDYPLFYYINAANDYKTLEEAKEKFIKTCPICFETYPIQEMVIMVECAHSLCNECFRAHYQYVIKHRAVQHFNCCVCSEPDLSNQDTRELYLGRFIQMIKLHVDAEMYHLFQKRLTEFNLCEESDFYWHTNTNCRSGFINDCQQDIKCITNSKHGEKIFNPCISKRLLEEEHQGIFRFAQWKTDNDPEAQEQGLATYLKANGIKCPSCHMHYDLAHGGCIHFHCTQCLNEFCSSCGQSFKEDRDCGKFESCATKGLHAHHPRDCLYHLRDFSVEELQKFLKANNIIFDTDPTPEQLEVARKKACVEMWEEREALEGEEEEEIHLELKCIVMVQKEIPDGFVDEECGRDVVEGHAGICDLHYKEYLVSKINQGGLDPTSMYETDKVKLILMQEELEVPEREEEEEEEEEYRERLIKHVQEQLPLQRIKMALQAEPRPPEPHPPQVPLWLVDVEED